MLHWLHLEQVTSKQAWTRSSARETSNLAAKQGQGCEQNLTLVKKKWGTMDVDETWF